jgi:Ni2+-binding GTPase involved in maturation of urease and hydrogenase
MLLHKKISFNKYVMAKTKLIFIGGFLGAGKTTLLHEVTRRLISGGIRVGLITNDQAPDLADTALLKHDYVNVAEVSGSCFCCDFKGLRRAIDNVGQHLKTDIIIAEPVGSCTDLSATLINPIKEMMKTEVSVCPLTVLVDPGRLRDILDENTAGLHPSAAYIMKKQLEESDIIAITKSDLYSQGEITELSQRLKENFPDCEIRIISSRTGEGIDGWLEYVSTSGDAGKHILEIDYDKYAEGEAVLGWLNCSASLSGNNIDWDSFTRKFMQDISAKFDEKTSSVGHVKMLVENGDQYISANLTGLAETLNFRWSAGLGNNAEMIVNARVEISPEELEKVFLSTLEKSTNNHIKIRINRIRSFSPGYPNPTHRFQKK